MNLIRGCKDKNLHKIRLGSLLTIKIKVQSDIIGIQKHLECKAYRVHYLICGCFNFLIQKVYCTLCQILGISGLRVDPNGRHLNLQVRLKLGVDGQRPRYARVETIIANGL